MGKGKISENSVEFIEIPYLSDNEFKDLKNGNKTKFETFVQNDKYWEQKDSTKFQGTQFSQLVSKYISGTLKIDIYKKYITTRYFISIVKYLKNKIENEIKNEKNINLSNFIPEINFVDTNYNFNNTKIRLDELIQYLLILYYQLNCIYFDKKENSYLFDNSNKEYYGISAYSFKNYNINNDIKNILEMNNDEIGKKFSDIKFPSDSRPYLSGAADSIIKIKNIIKLLDEDKNEGNSSFFSKTFFQILKNADPRTFDNTDSFEAIVSNNKDVSNYFISSLVLPLMEIPLEYYTRSFSIKYQTTESIYSSIDFRNFEDDIISTFFKSNENPLKPDIEYFEYFFNKENKQTIDEKKQKYFFPYVTLDNNELKCSAKESNETEITEKFNKVLEELKKALSNEQDIGFSNIEGNNETTISYLQSVIEFFMSYTTSLRSIATKNMYNNDSETVPYAESMVFHYESKKGDYVFFDEKLTIEE